MHTAVFQPGAKQPSPLIRDFNAIMVVGTAERSSLAPPQLLTLQFQVFQGEIHLSLTKNPLVLHFLLLIDGVPSFPSSPLLLLLLLLLVMCILITVQHF